MHLVEIDVIGPKPAQARLAGFDEVVPREPCVIRTGSHLEPRLGADQNPVAAAAQSLTDDLLRESVRIHIGGVHQVHTCIERHVDLTPRAVKIRLADIPELSPAAEPHRSQAQFRDAQSTAAQLSIFHAFTSRS